MAITKLQLYNGALQDYLGETALADLTEAREPRYVLDRIWDAGVVNYCLSKGNWQWATRTIKVDPDSGIEPDFGYKYAYPQPDDHVRTIALAGEEYFNEAITQFADERDIWFSDINPLYAKYVSNDAAYGGDFSRWPEAFSEYVMARLAYKAAPRITGVVVSADSLRARMKEALVEAQGIDGVNRPTYFPSRGSWNSARNGRWNTNRYQRFR